MASIDRRFLDMRVCVDGIVTTPGPEATNGTQYLVASSNATGVFAGHEKEVAYMVGNTWKFYAPQVGATEVFNLRDVKFYRYEGGSWVGYDIGASRVLEAVISFCTAGEGAPEADPENPPAAGSVYLDKTNNKIYTAVIGGWGDPADVTDGLRYASADDKCIYVVRNGAIEEEDVGDTIMFVCKADNNIWAYDVDSDSFVNLTSIQDNPDYKRHTVHEVATLTADQITAKAVELTKLAVLADGLSVVAGGVVQVPAVDYQAANDAQNTTTTISWDALGLASIPLIPGDKLIITYSTIED